MIKINYQKTLRDIAKSMVRLHRPDRLLKLITRLIDKQFKLTHTSFLVADPKNDRFVFFDSKGARKFPVRLLKMELDNPLAVYFQQHSRRMPEYLEASELRRRIEETGDCAGGPFQKILKLMTNFKVELAVPSFYKKQLLGMLLMGAKKDGSKFQREEISFFQILAQDCSMALKTSEYHQVLTEKNRQLEERIVEVETLRKKEGELYKQVMRCLAQEVYAKDAYTFGHISQVERLGLMTAKEMGLDVDGKHGQVLSAGLILHDVGKIGIPDDVLKKPAPLTDAEWKIMKTHPEKGARILSPLTDFKEVMNIVLSHHENWDGSGYPRGLKGEEIPLEARIVAVVDAFHAMVSTRTYSRGKSVEHAMEELERCAGQQFDPGVVKAFLQALKREMRKRGVGFFRDDEDQPHQAA